MRTIAPTGARAIKRHRPAAAERVRKIEEQASIDVMLSDDKETRLLLRYRADLERRLRTELEFLASVREHAKGQPSGSLVQPVRLRLRLLK